MSNGLNNKPGLLLVDDDPLIRDSLQFLLSSLYQVHLAETRHDTVELLHDMVPQPVLALVDLGLPPRPHTADEGFALIPELLAHNSKMRILVLSGQTGDANLRHAMALGAVDFISKPCEPELLKARLKHQLVLLQAEAKQQAAPSDLLVGNSAAMRSLQEQIHQFADAPFPVLIEGESGTGKELVARRLHQLSSRNRQDYIAVNCAAFSSELLESQLFGHAKGSFTGATRDHAGFFQEAAKGTLFLDEIGEMPMELQSKLLRVIENNEYYRVGETRPRISQVRIVAATNKNLLEEVRQHRFRQDLYYRLSILTVHVPALRQRADDCVKLLEHFQGLYSGSVPPFTLDDESLGLLGSYDFPGNVRELRNIVIRLGTKYPGQLINRIKLESEMESNPWSSGIAEDSVRVSEHLQRGDFRLDAHVEAIEWEYIQTALELSEGNLSKAAKLLNVNRTTLYSKIQRLEEKLGEVSSLQGTDMHSNTGTCI